MPIHRGQFRFAVAIVALGAFTGCVERRYTIRTDPPGALVIVNNEAIGTTPVSKSFTFYGERSVRIIKEGYETKELIQPIKAPWYDNLLTEFFTENLNPFTFRDEVEFNYKLDPARPADPNDVIARGETVRADGSGPPTPRRKGFLGFFGF